MEEKTCQLQLKYINLGPLRLSGKLALVDEFGKANHYGVQAWNFKSVPRFCDYLLRLGLIMPYAIDKGAEFLNKTAPFLSHNIPSTGITGGTLLSAFLALELILAGNTQFTRQTAPRLLRDKKPNKAFAITNSERQRLKKIISTKDHFYTFAFNNCNQQARRTFHKLKKDLKQKRQPKI